MLKKKPAKKLDNQDFTALDAAVSELNKQTAALLGKADGKTEAKPTLPKKQNHPQTKGKSFDIINHPRKNTTLQSSLKTAQKTPSAPAEPEALLPDHAGKSFNELEVDELPSIKAKGKDTPEEPKPKDAAAPVIKQHTGKLSLTRDDEDTPSAEEQPSADPALESAALAPQAVSHTSLSFEEKPEELKDEPAPETKKPEKEPEPEKSQPSEVTEAKEATVETKQSDEQLSYDSGELFANNLVKETQPKRHEPEKGQQKPTVFDTTEYHPELHDWSKLEHQGGWKWFILLLLLAVAGGLAYLIFSGQRLPFLQ